MPKMYSGGVFVAVVFLPMELLALCALALVEPGMSEADHWQICGQNS